MTLLWVCEYLRNVKHYFRVPPPCLWPGGEGGDKGWRFRGDSALPLENSRERQACPCRQRFLCQGCVYTGECLETLAPSLCLTCPTSPPPRLARGGGPSSTPTPSSASHTFPGLPWRQLPRGGMTSPTSNFTVGMEKIVFFRLLKVLNIIPCTIE